MINLTIPQWQYGATIEGDRSSTELSTKFVDNQFPTQQLQLLCTRASLAIESWTPLLRCGFVARRHGRSYTARPIFEGRDSASVVMKADIHPEYKAITVTCSCGNTFPTRSTLGEDLQIEVCSNCHPFYTGKQKVMDTGGRVDKFRKRYAK